MSNVLTHATLIDRARYGAYERYATGGIVLSALGVMFNTFCGGPSWLNLSLAGATIGCTGLKMIFSDKASATTRNDYQPKIRSIVIAEKTPQAFRNG